MAKRNMQKTLRIYLFTVLAFTVVGLAHLWFISSENINQFLITFAAIYALMTLFSFILAIKLVGKLKILAVINTVLAILVLVYDIFGLALSGMQF
jgi:hypothetical protein